MGRGCTIPMPLTRLSTLGCCMAGEGGFRAVQLQNESEKGREIARCFCAAGSALGRGEVGCCALLFFLWGGVGPLALAGGKGGGLEQLPTHPQAGPHPVPSLKGGQRPVPLIFIHCLCTEIGWERAHTHIQVQGSIMEIWLSPSLQGLITNRSVLR